MIKKLISAIILLSILCSCSSDAPANNTTHKLFFANSSNRAELVSVDTTLTAANTEDAIVELFSKLTSPENESHTSVIPKSVHLLDSSFNDGICNLILSEPYKNLSPYSLVAVNFVLVNTMSGLPGVKQVSITSENDTKTFSADNFLTSLPPAYYDSHTLNLHYPTIDYSETVKLEMTFVHEDEKTLEACVIELLAQSPENPDLRSPFPEGTKVNNIYREGTMCVLDLSPEFVTAAPHSAEAEKAIIYSIVNTLTELPDINSVKILIDGKHSSDYSFFDISSPFEHSS